MNKAVKPIDFFLFFLTFVVESYIIGGGERSELDTGVFELLNLGIAFICSCALFLSSGHPFTLYKVFHLFYLFFFCIAPTIQWQNRTTFQGETLHYNDYLLTSQIVFVIIVLFNGLYYYFLKHPIKKLPSPQKNDYHTTIKTKYEVILICISTFILFLFLYYNKFNMVAFLMRGVMDFQRTQWPMHITLLLNNFLRPMSMMFFLTICIYGTRHRLVKWILGINAFLICFPTAMPRFETAALYTPILLWFFPVFRRRHVFVASFVGALLVLFPYLHQFRRFDASGNVEKIGVNFSQFEDLHFDAFFMFAKVLKMHMITDGLQLLGTFLFWVPRSIWTAKPVGSGQMIAEESQMFFTNLSMPYFAEGYINFGYLGVFLFTIIMACFCAYWDDYYWEKNRFIRNNVNQVVYYLLIGLLFLILRGDLMNAMAYTCGIIGSFLFTRWLCLR